MKISIDKICCVSLLIAILGYLAQPMLGLAGIIGPPLLILILAISTIFSVKFWLSNCPKDALCWTWLFFLTYSVILYLISGRIDDYGEMRNFLLNFLPFYAFLYFSSRNVLNDTQVKVFFCLLVIVFIFNMEATSQQIATETGRDEFANNAAYHIMGLLPFVFLFRKNTIVLFFILLLSWYAVGSMKRSVLIVSIFAAGLYGYSYFYKDKTAYKIKGITLAMVSLAILIGLGVYYYVNIGLGERFEQRIMLMINEGHSAGRDVLVRQLYAEWVESNSVVTYLFGLGYSSSKIFTVGATHNDFIKALGESGIVGLLLFLTLVMLLISRVFFYSINKEYRLPFIMFFASMLMAALTSRWYGASFFYMNCVLLPFLLSSQLKTVR